METPANFTALPKDELYRMLNRIEEDMAAKRQLKRNITDELTRRDVDAQMRTRVAYMSEHEREAMARALSGTAGIAPPKGR